jgi:Carboxypeptidase regulatory-like domain
MRKATIACESYRGEAAASKRCSAMKTALRASLAFLWFAGQLALAQATGSIQGHVTDSSGTPIYAAVVTVEDTGGNRHATATDLEGAFKISSLPPGDYTVKISASGLSDWTASNVPASESSESKPLQAVLEVATEVTTITVSPPIEEVASEQLHQELQQRFFGVIPNYFVTYEKHPAPLSPPQKLHLGLKTILDPTTFAAAGITAAIQQKMNSYWQWGQGGGAYTKRFAAAYGTGVQQIMITSVLADSVLHQDPRYFYSGQGTRGQRAWYAVKSAFRAKGDNGKWQPPYAGVIGAVASAEISQTYYPGSRTQYTLLGRSLMFHFAGLIALNLGEEFFFKKLTSHTPKFQAAADLPVLHEGTAVPLIAVDGFSAEGPAPGQIVTFVLAQELTVRGQTLANAGDVASGQVSQVSTASAAGEPMSVALDRVTLHAGSVNVPLRSSQVRGGVNPMQFKESPDSGKVEVTLFVAENVQFPERQ